MKVVFFGTPQFAVSSLETLFLNDHFEIVGVVTQPDRPIGRKKVLTPPPVKVFALAHGLKVLQPAKLKDQAVDDIINLGAELAVVVAYGNLIPKRLLEAVPAGFVNIHFSLLPKHRGASPVTATILNGDAETGVCLMVLDEGMDHGPVIACRRLALKGDETTESLREQLAPLGIELLNQELIEYLGGHMVSVPQDHEQATICKPIEADAARIDWRKPVAEIDRLVRAMRGVTPAWTTLGGQIFLVHAGTVDRQHAVEAPGMVVKIQNNPAVAGADGYLVLTEVQPAGGKAMSGQAFLNGHQDFIGKTLV